MGRRVRIRGRDCRRAAKREPLPLHYFQQREIRKLRLLKLGNLYALCGFLQVVQVVHFLGDAFHIQAQRCLKGHQQIHSRDESQISVDICLSAKFIAIELGRGFMIPKPQMLPQKNGSRLRMNQEKIRTNEFSRRIFDRILVDYVETRRADRS